MSKVAESSEDGKGKGRAESSTWPPTHINTMVATRALEEFQSYWVERRGDHNVPVIFLKAAQWFDKDGADGYYCHYDNKGWKHIEFSFEFLAVTIASVEGVKGQSRELCLSCDSVWIRHGLDS